MRWDGSVHVNKDITLIGGLAGRRISLGYAGSLMTIYSSAEITNLSLVGIDHCKGVVLQAPEENDENIYFGEKGSEVIFIKPGGSSSIDTNSLTDIYLKTDHTQLVNILVY